MHFRSERRRIGVNRFERLKAQEAMGDRLARYIEWQSAGRRTGRVAYIVGTQNLPAPSAGAEWQIDSKFNVADEILRDPGMKSFFKAVISKGVKVVTSQ